jgi:putative Mg2+ transporter-C (MgtC) family protein
MQLFRFADTQWEILIIVGLAMALGAAIGFEREVADKPAGLRTHMLVAGAAAFLVALGDVVVVQFDLDVERQLIQADPIRLMEAVITGVSFLGAGTIIRHRGSGYVEGLTTAASVFFASAIGMAVALGQGLLAIGVTIIVLIILRGLNYVRRRIVRDVQDDEAERDVSFQ